MPYDTLPERLREIIPSSAGQEIFRNVVNQQLASGKSEAVAMASAWAALQRAGYDKDDDGKWTRKTQPTMSQVHVPGAEWDDDERKVYETLKRMLDDDIFTTSAEAAVRSMDIGLNGEVHVHQNADGQAMYMPGSDHETYLRRMAELAGVNGSDTVETPDSSESRQDLLERVISAIMQAAMKQDVTKTAEVLKLDKERRIAWGWASVSTMKGELVTDLQGDSITPAEMEKMADRFMASARQAKAMHEGDKIGEVLHSLPLTNELAKAFGMTTDREGWIIGMKIYDDEVFRGFREGRYKGFSIGGKAKRKPKDYDK